MHKNFPKILLMALMILLVLAPSLSAQEPTPSHNTETTAVLPTLDPTSPAARTQEAIVVTVVPEGYVVVEAIEGINLPSLVTFIAIGYILLQGIIGAVREKRLDKLLESYRQLAERKDVRDGAEAEYLRSSVRVQELTRFTQQVFKSVGELNLPMIDGFVDVTNEVLTDVVTPNDTPKT